MADPKILKVRNQFPDVLEVEVRSELQPIRGPELAHRATRRNTTVDHPATLTADRGATRSPSGSRCGSAVVSSTTHIAPKRRVGRRKSPGSLPALKRIRKL